MIASRRYVSHMLLLSPPNSDTNALSLCSFNHPVKNARRKQRAESIADNVAAVENRGTRAELISLVPFTEEEQRAWEESCFHKAQEESCQEGANEAEIRVRFSPCDGLFAVGRTDFFVMPVSTDMIPHMIMHMGNCRDGFPRRLRSMFLSNGGK